MISDTSLHAYALATQHLGAKQKAVLDALRFFPDATNAEIAAHLAWPINRITPRMGELRQQGLVLESCRRRCKVTGGMAWAWVAKYPVLPPAFEEKPKVEQSNTLFHD
jgi:predicted transcriptional regulator